MLSKVSGVIIIVSVIFSVVFGNVDAMAVAVLEGAADAVNLTISLVGMMCLWCGVLNVLREAGVVAGLATLMRPMIRLFFPDAVKSGDADNDIAANVAANLMGMGNAATPFAISAMSKLQKLNGGREVASDDMITLAVLNTSSVSLIPSTVLALLRGQGCSDPFSVVIPIWISSSFCALLSLVMCRLAAVIWRIFGIRREKRAAIKTEGSG